MFLASIEQFNGYEKSIQLAIINYKDGKLV